jgi:hypothetical protein
LTAKLIYFSNLFYGANLKEVWFEVDSDMADGIEENGWKVNS